MRKVLSLTVVIALILSCTVFRASAETKSGLTVEELELLYVLGITSSPELTQEQLSAPVTRGNAAKYFCNMLNIEVAEPEAFECVFYDVTSDSYNYKYISAICKAGYMQGYGDGRFRPNDPISTMEAARVITSIVGYKGYIAVTSLTDAINKTDALDGVAVVEEMELGQLLKMIHNILFAPACEVKGVGTDIVNFSINKDYNGLEYLYGIIHAHGVVDAIPATSFVQASPGLKENRVSVNGFVHDYVGDASAFLGYAVEYYYRNDTDGYDIVYMEKSEKNRTEILNYDEIIGYSDFTYTYEYKNGTKTVGISPDTVVIYNGVACIAPSADDMIPKFGQVTLIDNDGKGGYDVVLIENYEFLVADSVNMTKMTIKDRLNGDVLDLSEADRIKVLNNGEEYAMDRIYGGNLLKIKQSKPESGYYTVEIEVSKQQLDGVTIAATGKDSLTVLGEKYDLWSNIDQSSKSNIFVGNSVTIHVYDGTVVYVEKNTGIRDYAYLISMSEPEVLSNQVKFRLLLPNMDEVIYENNGKIKVDGVLLSDLAEIENALIAGARLSAAPNAGAPIAQPVIYTLTKKGQLSSIDTFFFNAETEDAETSLRKKDSGRYRFNSTSKGLYFEETGEFTAILSTSSVMRVPSSDRMDTIDYTKSAPSNNGRYTMDICSVDEETKMAEFVFYYLNPYTSGTSSPYIVLDKYIELSNEGDAVEVLKLGSKGNEYEYPVCEEMKNISDTIDVGDIVSIELNRKNWISGLTKTYSLTEVPARENRVKIFSSTYNNTTAPPYSDGSRMLYGTPLSLKNGNMIFTLSLPDDFGGVDENYMTDNIVVSSAVFYKYSFERGLGKVEKVSSEELVPFNVDPANPSTIVVDIYGNTVRQVFLIEK